MIFTKFVSLFCLFLTFSQITVQLNTKISSKDFDFKDVVPIAKTITIEHEYYDEGEGPQEEDEESEDSVDTNVDTTMDSSVITTESDVNSAEDNVEMAVGGLSGIINKLIKGPKKKDLPKDSKAEQVYIYLSKMFAVEVDKSVKAVLPKVYDYTFTINDLVSQNCFNALAQFGNKARTGEPTALELLDSSAKLPNGLLSGTFADFGNFDQCLRIRVYDDIFREINRNSKNIWNGKYCLLKVKTPLPQRQNHLKYSHRLFNYRNTSLENTATEYLTTFSHSLYSNPFLFGLCFPSTCTAGDIKQLFHNFMTKFQFEIDVKEENCYVDEGKCFVDLEKIQFTQIIAIAIIAILSTLVAFSSLYELFITNFFEKKTEKPFLIAFSAFSNAKQLFSTKSNNEKSLLAINGIKCLTMVWIVTANTYLLGFEPQLRPLIKNVHQEMQIKGQELVFQLVLNIFNASEIFFLISGFLMAFNTIPIVKKGSIDLFRFVAHRWIRLTPSLIFVILLVFLFPLVPNGGPLYDSSVNHLVNNCQQNWLKSVFFVSNWFPFDQTCLPHFWFLSALFQLHIIGVLVLILAQKKPKLGLNLVLFMIFIGIIAPSIIASKQDLSPISPIINRPLLDEIPNDVLYAHFLTVNHFSSYFSGLAIALLIIDPKFHLKLNFCFRAILWTLLPLLSLGTVLVTVLWNNWESEPSMALSMAYYGLHRIFFVALFAFVLHECALQRGGLVNSFLSHKLFKPLNRLTFQIFLLNLVIIWFNLFSKRDFLQYRHLEMCLLSVGVFVFTTIVSVFSYLVFEIPFINLWKIKISEKIVSNENEMKDNEMRENVIHFDEKPNNSLRL